MTADGMVPAGEWAKTNIHIHSGYFCGKCGEMFPSPQAVYDHLDEVHKPPRKTRKGKPPHEAHRAD